MDTFFLYETPTRSYCFKDMMMVRWFLPRLEFLSEMRRAQNGGKHVAPQDVYNKWVSNINHQTWGLRYPLNPVYS